MAEDQICPASDFLKALETILRKLHELSSGCLSLSQERHKIIQI
jgi:hypothetical protein